MMTHFKSPEAFLLLLLIPLIYTFFFKRKRSVIKFSSLEDIKNVAGRPKRTIQILLLTLKTIALVFFIAALARPQQVEAEREFETKGIDIVMALDISGSMLAEDFQPINRITVAKEEAKKFIQGRENDRIGLVVFAFKSYTQCPMTLDYHILTQLLDSIEVGLIKDGTAIGLGIANAVNRLRDSKAKSKIIILLSDGENNSGNIDPITAAELAKSFGIKIYTIGIGRNGLVPFPVEDPIFGKRKVQVQVTVDERSLKRIADITGGLYFSATNAEALSKIYEQINKLEKSEVKVKEFTSFREQYHWFLMPGFLILILEIILQNILFKKIP
jgi:Ca-activated chloride channel family protein